MRLTISKPNILLIILLLLIISLTILSNNVSEYRIFLMKANNIHYSKARSIRMRYFRMNQRKHAFASPNDFFEKDEKDILGKSYLIGFPKNFERLTTVVLSKAIPDSIAKEIAQPDTGWLEVPERLKPYLLDRK